MKKTRLFLLTLAMCLLLAFSASAATVAQIPKYGNLVLDITGTELLAQGYAYGDIVSVQLGGASYDMPVGSSYSDVDAGSMVCRVTIDPENGEDSVVLAICMGDMATATGVAVKTVIEEEPGYRWDYLVEQPVEVSFAMKEAGGYAAEYQLRQLTRTNAREDYPHLSDAQFANFRPVATAGMGEGVLYRSSSPVNPELGRNAFADAALEAAGVRTVINLADTLQGMEAYEGFAQTAYAACERIGLGLSVDVLGADFQTGLAQGLHFLIAHEGPYLVHCNEGKDRAGFVSALLECLMGAPLDEVEADYMLTYANYYGVQPGTEQYEAIANATVRKQLAAAFDAELQGDLSVGAQRYLTEKLGFSAQEVEQLMERLGHRK